jgi:N-acetylneuraminic acid mutarotase
MNRPAAILVVIGLVSFTPVLAKDRSITFADRVAAQRTIERFYYARQIGAAQPFATAVPDAVVEEKARRGIRLSMALETIWKTPITADMLRSEAERIARDTRFPDRLRTLYAALGNDPVLYQETIVRATLAERLAREAFEADASLQAKARAEAGLLMADLRSGRMAPGGSDPRLRMTDVALDESGSPGQEEADGADPVGSRPPAEMRLPRHRFEALRTRITEEGRAPTLIEDSSAYAVRVVVADSPDLLKLATYVVPKRTWDEWWSGASGGFDARLLKTVAHGDRPLPPPAGSPGGFSPLLREGASPAAPPAAGGSICAAEGTWSNGSLETPPPENVSGARSVWTGSLMIVWGGFDIPNNRYVNAGSRYDPMTDTWRPTTRVGAPIPRSAHTAVWTGSRMIVWGGTSRWVSASPWGVSQGDGGVYDPTSDTWLTIPAIGPDARQEHAAIWTGSRMIVWGGRNVTSANSTGTFLGSGGIYDLSTNTWTAVSTTNAPSGRSSTTAVWAAGRMIVWGGRVSFNTFTNFTNTGGRYNPADDTWTATTLSGAPSPRASHAAISTGDQMILWGGGTIDGARYDPVLDQWVAILGGPEGQVSHQMVWTGDEVLIWGGTNAVGAKVATGARYDPLHDVWSEIQTTGAPGARAAHTAVWAGDRMLIWGGDGGGGLPPSGNAAYDPVTDGWSPINNHFVPSGREGRIGVWTGNLMLMESGRYDPLLDSWSPIPQAPVPTTAGTSVWTGQEMIVWGGRPVSVPVQTGARYNPVTDSWIQLPTTGAPAARHEHSAIWTGSEMIVWGGRTSSFLPTETGGRYRPSTDSWLPMASGSTPRTGHSAIWTGSRMIVWGGDPNSTGYLNTGELYDPSTDSWTGTTTTVGAPGNRVGHLAVWTGTEMLIWGGLGPSPFVLLNSGGRYNPSTNQWAPMSQTNAPAPRRDSPATWNGSQMLVWGGSDLGTGGQYDPAGNVWITMPAADAPIPRSAHRAVLAGDGLIVWGGSYQASYLNSGGLYCPCSAGMIFHLDADGDGRGTPGVIQLACGAPAGYTLDGTDCNDADTTTWHKPSETGSILFDNQTQFSWTSPGDPGGSSAPLYDVLRSVAPDFLSGVACLATNLSGLATADAAVPAAGACFFYRVRAGNACGEGIIGTGPGGSPVTGPACP